MPCYDLSRLSRKRAGDYDALPRGTTFLDIELPGMSISFVRALRESKDVGRTLAHELFHLITQTSTHVRDTLMEQDTLGKNVKNVLIGAQWGAMRRITKGNR